MELQYSAAFENSPGEAHIRFRRRRVTGGVIMDHDEGVRGEHNRRLKHFARMRERLVDTALAERMPVMPQTVLLRSELSPALRLSPRKRVVLGVRVIDFRLIRCLINVARKPHRNAAIPKATVDP